jgi:hypothetical protein
VTCTVLNVLVSPVEWLVVNQLVLTLASSLCRLNTLMVILMWPYIDFVRGSGAASFQCVKMRCCRKDSAVIWVSISRREKDTNAYSFVFQMFSLKKRDLMFDPEHWLCELDIGRRLAPLSACLPACLPAWTCPSLALRPQDADNPLAWL